MLSTTTEDDSDDCHYKGRRKQCREKVLQSSSSDSDDCIIARPRRKKCRVASSSSESDDSLLTRPSRKKCKVLSGTESSASSSSASDSDCDEKLRRWSDKRPKKRTITTDSEASSYEDDANPAKRRASNTTPTAATVADANSSDSDEGERCIICFKTLRPPLAHPSGCTHNFHPVCLATWSKTSNTCPIDRVKYTAIITVDGKGDLISREGVSSPPPQDHNADFEPDDATFCEVCSQHDREHEMLLCDRCEAGYHMDCLTPPLLEVPEGNWYCPRCEDLGLELREEINGLIDDAAVILESRMRRQQSTVRMPRGPRTRGAQRVFNIIHRQTGGQQPSTSSAVTISRQRGSSSRRPRHNSSRRAQSTRYKVELITVEDGTTLEVKVAVNTRTRTKSKRYKNRRTKKRCSKNARRSGESSSRRASENHVAGEGPSRPLDLFGSRPTLDYFSGCEAEDELDDDRGGQLGVLLRASRTGPRNMAVRKQMAAQILNSSQRRVAPRIAVSSAPVDLVSSILEQQEKWHSPNASYESTSNGNIRVILKDKAGHSRQGGDTTTETSGSGTSSSQPPTSTSRADKPSTSTAPESGPSSHSPAQSQISSSSRAQLPPESDSPQMPLSPSGTDMEPKDLERLKASDENKKSPPGNTDTDDNGKDSDKGHSVSSPVEPIGLPSETPLDNNTSTSEPLPSPVEADCKSPQQTLLEGGAAGEEGPEKDTSEKNHDICDVPDDANVGEETTQAIDADEKIENPPEEMIPKSPPAFPGVVDNALDDSSELTTKSDVCPLVSEVDRGEQTEHESTESATNQEPNSPCQAAKPERNEDGEHCSPSSQNPDPEPHEPVVPQEQKGSQDEEPLSDGNSCDDNNEDNDCAKGHDDEETRDTTDDELLVAGPVITARRMSNCSDFSDDSDCDRSSSKRDSPAHEHSDGETRSNRQVYQPLGSPKMDENGRHDLPESTQRLNGSRPISPNEEISSDSINFNSSGERQERLRVCNNSDEEKDGLVEITDEEMSNYEKTWEMEKNQVQSTELEGLEAISDVESTGHKSSKSDGENSGMERLEDGLETISDLEAEGQKNDGLETISDLEPDGLKADKPEDDAEDTPDHQPSVPDDTPEDTQIEEEGEIRDDEAPVPWKKISSVTKERSYRGMKELGKEISKEIVLKDRRVELDRCERITTSDRGRKKRESSSSSSSDSLSRGEKEKSVPRVKRKRSRSRTRSRDKDRDRTRSRDRARDRTRSRDRERDRIRSRDRARDKSVDRIKERSCSRISRDRYRRGRSRDRRSRSRDRKRRRTRSPRKERSRSRGRNRRSRDRKRSKRSPSESSSSDCSSCSCSSCEREEMKRQKRRGSKDRDRSKDKDKSKRDRSPRSKKRRTPGPSKEVFTSGDNILVSVNFKKDGEVSKAKDPPPAERKRDRKKDEKERPRKDRKESKENKSAKRKESPRKPKKKKKIDTSNMKTVAIIDLDTSPFRVTTPTNELIILSDSDGEEKAPKIDPRMGPRTPPEPQMKFTLAKKQQIRNMTNPLLTMERDGPREEDLKHHRGPNTPPEPEIRSPYDPFEPTKSPTPDDSRVRQSPNQEPNQQVPQVSLTPPRARPQHVAPTTPSPLHSPPSTLEQQDRPKLMPFQPVPANSDDSPGGGGGGDSPYSPGSSEGDDLFDPPQQLPPPKPKPRVPLPLPLREQPSKHTVPPPKRPNTAQKELPMKGLAKKEGGIKIDENQQKLLDDLPNSAVEMQFIEKLHRQERVVEEVKLILKPHYAKKHINKEEYKEILRRSVPKICHSRTGEINLLKIQKLIDAYVQRFRHKRKLAAGGGNAVPNPAPLQRPNKPVVIK